MRLQKTIIYILFLLCSFTTIAHAYEDINYEGTPNEPHFEQINYEGTPNVNSTQNTTQSTQTTGSTNNAGNQNLTGPRDYTPLSPLPGTFDKSTGKASVKTFLPGMYRLLVILTGVFAIVMITFGGVQYMSTDAVNGKSDGKERINAALGGLILAVTSYLILYTVDPKILSFDLNIEPVTITRNDTPVKKLGDGEYCFPVTDLKTKETFKACNYDAYGCQQRKQDFDVQGPVYESKVGCQIPYGKTDIYCFDLYKYGESYTPRVNCFSGVRDGKPDITKAREDCEYNKSQWEQQVAPLYSYGACVEPH